MRKFPLLLAGLIVAAAACGTGAGGTGGDPNGGDARPAATSFPVTVTVAGDKVRIPARPQHIVSLSPTATEMLFAIGAGDQVEAVDDQSDYPPDVPTTELSGFEPNVEAIASYEPDLVVFANDPGDLADSMDKLKIPALMLPAATDLSDTYEQIRGLGTATGHEQEADELVASMRSEIEEIVTSVPDFDRPPTYYHELDDNYFTATSKTFIGQVYGLLGLENISDEADKDNTGYPQLSAEYIVESDPDLIFLADTECCGQSAETISKRPGWDRIQAVTTGSVVALDDDVASRWGPRVVDYLRTVAAAVRSAEEGTS